MKQIHEDIKVGKQRATPYQKIVAPVSLTLIIVGLYLAFTWRSIPPVGIVNVRSTIALFVAPAAATGVLFFSDLARGRLNGFPVITVLGFGVIAYLVATAVTFALGMPTFSFLRRFNLVRWWSALASGAAIGVLVALPFGFPFRDGGATAIMSGAGAFSALIFWLIVRPVTPPANRGSGRDSCQPG